MSDYILRVRGEDGPWQGIPAIKGDPGDPGFSPTVAVTDIEGGHRVTITDEDGDHVFDVMDGQGGGGGTGDHNQLTNRDAANQHPMDAITGLLNEFGMIADALDDVADWVNGLRTGKQDRLTAGRNISIVDNVISATGGGTDHVFNVQYGTTPFASIKAASDAGKICRMKIGIRIYCLVAINSSNAYFVWTAHGGNKGYVVCNVRDEWSEEVSETLQLQAITDPGDYFNADTVEGALQEIGGELQSKQNALLQGGASVGQIAKIASVDASGKPTAWQAVNMPQGGGGDDVWEFGGTIPLDLTTPVARYEFAECSIWKKVRILRLRPEYVSTLKSNVWFGVSPCERSGGRTGTELTPIYFANGYNIQQVEMEYDNLGGIVAKSFSTNNGNAQVTLEAAPYTSVDAEASAPSSYKSGRIAPNSNWMFYAVDPAASWDGTETYYWWGVRA